MTSTAPSMIAAPESIVAINASCPGASTKLIALVNTVSEAQFGQMGFVEKFFGASHFGHLYIGRSAYPSLIVMPRFSSSLCLEAQTPVKDWTSVVFPWSTCPIVPMLTSGCLGRGLLSLL